LEVSQLDDTLVRPYRHGHAVGADCHASAMIQAVGHRLADRARAEKATLLGDIPDASGEVFQ
jgi:hypothetical protein